MADKETTLKRFKFNLSGFQKNFEFGELIAFEGTTYVIIKVLSIKRTPGYNRRTGSPNIQIEFVGQDINGMPPENTPKQTQQLTVTYDMTKSYLDEGIRDINDIVTYDSGYHGIIRKVNTLHYEQTDLKIDYGIEMILPWSKYKMDKAIEKHRLRQLKVIQGGKD